MLPWLDRGGVFVETHVRGGGEGGLDWHLAGKIETKEHTISDFIDCADWLIAHHYTDHAHIAGEGTSAGGILIGGAITQDPSLFRAALIRVGSSNASRAEFTENGPSNVPEFGTVTNPAQLPWLLAMDAYQHVRAGHRLSGGAAHRRGGRPARFGVGAGEDDGAAAGGEHERAAGAAAHRVRRRARAWLDADAARRRDGGRVRVPAVAVRRARLPAGRLRPLRRRNRTCQAAFVGSTDRVGGRCAQACHFVPGDFGHRRTPRVYRDFGCDGQHRSHPVRYLYPPVCNLPRSCADGRQKA